MMDLEKLESCPHCKKDLAQAEYDGQHCQTCDTEPFGFKKKGFDKERLKASPDYPKVWEIILLLIEARDALPAITLTAAKLRRIDLTLADRIEKCLEPWETTADDPEGI